LHFLTNAHRRQNNWRRIGGFTLKTSKNRVKRGQNKTTGHQIERNMMIITIGRLKQEIKGVRG